MLQVALVAALSLAGLYEALLRATGAQADYAESNLQANLARISTYFFQPTPENLILGSSLSGRLLPKFFLECGRSFGTLAMDGAGVPMGLELLPAKQEMPQRLFLEANSLFFRSPANEQTLREAIQNPVFRLGEFFYFCRPQSRPSALLYSLLKHAREARESGTSGLPPSEGPGGTEITREMDGHLLRQIGPEKMQIFLVVIPSGRGETMPGPAARNLAAEMNARWIFPREHLQSEGKELRYTDGLHLDQNSARRVCRVILEQTGLLNPENSP